MQPNKVKKKKSEFEIFSNNPKKLTSYLIKVMDKFKLKRNIAIFDFIKTKRLAISSIVSLTFHLIEKSVANISNL